MTFKDQKVVEQYLRSLDAYGFDTKPLWRELASRVESYEAGTPGMEDVKYTCPLVPPSITEHLEGGKPQVLHPAVMWQGYHYMLSPGQRQYFREVLGMTPAQTVTIAWVELWKGTQHPRSFKVVSDEHVDPRLRRHTLTEVVIRNAGEFFTKAYEFEAETAKPDKRELNKMTLSLGFTYDLETYQKWVIEDLGDVKLPSRVVQVIHIGEVIKFKCETKTTVECSVNAQEMWDSFATYEKLYANGKAKKKSEGEKKSSSVAYSSLDDMFTKLAEELK